MENDPNAVYGFNGEKVSRDEWLQCDTHDIEVDRGTYWDSHHYRGLDEDCGAWCYADNGKKVS